VTTGGKPKEDEGNETENVEVLSTNSPPSPEDENIEVLSTDTNSPKKANEEDEKPELEGEETEEEKKQRIAKEEAAKNEAFEKAQLLAKQKNYNPEGQGQRQRTKLKQTGKDLKSSLKSAATPPKFSDDAGVAAGEMMAWLMSLLLGAVSLPALAGAKALYHKGMAAREDRLMQQVSPQLDRMEKLMEKRDKVIGQIEKLKKDEKKLGESPELTQKIKEKEAKLEAIEKGISGYKSHIDGLLTDKMKEAQMAKEGATEKLKDIAASKELKEKAKGEADEWVQDVEARIEENQQALKEAQEQNKDPKEIEALKQEGEDLKGELQEAKELQKNAGDELNKITKLEKATLAELEKANKDIGKREDQAQRFAMGTQPGGITLGNGSETPEVETPEVETSELETSELETSELETSELETSELETSELETSELETPEVGTPVMQSTTPSEPTPEDLTNAVGLLAAQQQILATANRGTDEEAKKQAKEGYEKMLGEFVDYKSGLSKENQSALMAELNRIGEVADMPSLKSDVSRVETMGVSPPPSPSSFMQRIRHPTPSLPKPMMENQGLTFEEAKKHFEDNKDLLGIQLESGKSGFINDFLKIQKLDNPSMNMVMQKQQGGGVSFGLDLKPDMPPADKEKSLKDFCNLVVESTQPGGKLDISNTPEELKPQIEKFMNDAINNKYEGSAQKPQVVGGSEPKPEKDKTQRLG